MFSIPQSTSFVAVFKAFLSADHVSEATGKTIAITISKAGGSFANPNAGATNATEISGGWYKVTLDTTDTGTLGILALRGTASGTDDVGDRFYVVKATNGGLTALPDVAAEGAGGLFTRGTGAGQINQPANGMIDANVVRNAGTAITAASGVQEVKVASVAAGAITAAAIADAAIDAATFASGALDAVWSTAARTLTAGTNIQLPSNGLANVTSWSVAITGNITGNLSGSAGSVTGAVGSVTGAVGSVTGLTASDVGAIKAKTDNLPASPAAVGDIPTANQNADALLDRSAGIETGKTPRQGLRLMLAALVGKASGLAGTTATYRDTGDSKDRIVATVDADGNRSAVTLDAS